MPIQPKDRAIIAYYDTLANYEQQGISHEMAVRQAFATLLEATAHTVGWFLLMEYTIPNRKRIDGILRDEFRIPRGYWEAKDSNDDLETEITKKIAVGYPLSNTIFEDTRQGILYQNGQRVMVADITQPQHLADLLNQFFSYTEPQIEEFHTAVTTFQERIPELAAGLIQRIAEEYHDNPAFVAAFDSFTALCQEVINPNISMDAIKEMLVQHLLTERLFRTIFDNPDFTRRNIIAFEIEQVIDTLTSRSFSRSDFLKSLDHFYVAIEQAAGTISDFAEKQAFLNTVYERFFQGFSHKQADTYGIVYTPQEIVDFMCASVEVVLEQEFGKTLSSEGVNILDPCVGTGNFMVNILNRLSPRSLQHKYAHELFCNEVMLLPYYIATLNIEHAYYERVGRYAPFDGICFIDTLDMDNAQTSMFSLENTRRVRREQDADIMIIIGNPPYNMGQVNENDNNKNRKYTQVDQRVRETYAKDSQAKLKNKLYDPYVKFFRWATDRLNEQDGIICFVSNNSFIRQIAFDGMRHHLAQDFTRIYHLDLHGNVRQNPKLSGTTHNVFGIQVGVGITLLVHKAAHTERQISYYRVPEDWRKEQKLAFLAEHGEINRISWERLQQNEQHAWITEGLHTEFATFLPMGARNEQALFDLYSLGVVTSRDEWVYAFDQTHLAETIQQFIEHYNYEVFRYTQRNPSPDQIDTFINTKQSFLKWTDRLKKALIQKQTLQFDQQKIRKSLYRPFCQQFVYFDHLLNQRRYQQHRIFPDPACEMENIVICVSGIGSNKPFHALVSSMLPCLDLLEKTQCFPFYTYDEDGSNRRENITDWALAQFVSCYGDGVGKWDIFWYSYALLHHPTYRKRYAENLRMELPRIPLLGDSETFHTLASLGKQLGNLHLHYEQVDEYPLEWQETPNVPWTWRVERMHLTNDQRSVVVNDALTLAGVPETCFAYRLGNRSALEWVIDQYRVKTDSRSGITSDPNRHDDQEYITRLVGRVVQVSVQTVALVERVGAIALTPGK
jgi:predicted helicase